VRLCYVDEAGNAGVYAPVDPASTPVFVVAGVSVDAAVVPDLTMAYLRLKARFEPSLGRRELSEAISHEVKGASLRRDIREEGSRDTRRRAIGFLDKTVRLLESRGARLFGRVLVKRPGEVYSAASTYPSAVAVMAETFARQLADLGARGLMVLDSQTKVKNEGNVHTITTRRFRRGGGVFPELIESPVFGHSDTHPALQIADVVASGLAYPAACAAYSVLDGSTPHLSPSYDLVRRMLGNRLAALEYVYVNDTGSRRGGFHVIDRVEGRPGRLLLGTSAGRSKSSDAPD
jgi:hypothetical protein